MQITPRNRKEQIWKKSVSALLLLAAFIQLHEICENNDFLKEYREKFH